MSHKLQQPQNQRFHDQQSYDQQLQDRHYHDQQYHDQQYHDQQYHDQRYHDQYYRDQQYHHQQYHDQRYYDQQFPDLQFQQPQAAQQMLWQTQYPSISPLDHQFERPMPDQPYDTTTTHRLKRKAVTKPTEFFDSTVAKRSRPDCTNATIKGPLSSTTQSCDFKPLSKISSLPRSVHFDGNDSQSALEINAESPATHNTKQEPTPTTIVNAAEQALPSRYPSKPLSSCDSSRTPPTTQRKSAYEGAQPALVTDAETPIIDGDKQHSTSGSCVTATSLALKPLPSFKLMSSTDYFPTLTSRFAPSQEATWSTLALIAKTIAADSAKVPVIPATYVSASSLALNDLHHLIGLSKEIIHDYWTNATQLNNNGIVTLVDLIATFRKRAWYCSVTFFSLRAALDIPAGWLVVITFDESPARQPITRRTTDIAYINHEPYRDHWTLVHLSIREWRVIYYDGIVGEDGNDHLRTKLNCAKAINDVRFKRPRPGVDLPDEDPPMLAMYTIRQKESHSCGPLAFREIEVLLGRNTPEDQDQHKIRIRHRTMVEQHMIDRAKALALHH